MTIDVKGIQESFNWLEKMSRDIPAEVIRKTTQAVYDEVKKGAGKHIVTGKLESNIEKKVKSNAGVVWIDNSNMMVDWRGKQINYALFVLFGTKAHKIEAKNKKALRFGLNSFIFAHSVNHPGYKGDNFMDRAMDTTFNNLERILR